jgi:hypothetical protein
VQTHIVGIEERKRFSQETLSLKLNLISLTLNSNENEH